MPLIYYLGRILNCHEVRRNIYRVYIIYQARFSLRKDESVRGNIEKLSYTQWKGYCIRCGEKIVLNLAKPYCMNCWRVWNKYKNFEYGEQYCHECREPFITTRADPLCDKCR